MMFGEIEDILYTPEAIQERIRELALEIDAAYRGKDLSIVAVLTGSLVFLADLIRFLPFPLTLNFLTARSYRAAVPNGDIEYVEHFKEDLTGRNVLVIDDIIDTGGTMQCVCENIRKYNPASLATCILLDKPSRRKTDISADWIGFSVPDEFIVGYGLDFKGHYRNLPYLAALSREIIEGGPE
ncbi:MAG: hypoxanthine phosphoribosyltransferase [Planctomycetota bacterium]|jgi:hypoxanthine phosphoribosyltransferase